MDSPIRLGLIGDNIGASRAPRLHVLAGLQNGCAVTYDRLVPRDTGKDFDALFKHVARRGYRGINVTYPYKERVARKVVAQDPLVRAIGAVNTVLFDEGGPHGFNTDCSGFIAAYRRMRGHRPPGPTLVIGAGGVGRAIAFALVCLEADEIRIVDTDLAKAERLRAALEASSSGRPARSGGDAGALAAGAAGLVNCTPIGMVGHDGTPLARARMRGSLWAFDAVYTPTDTCFLRDAAAEGLEVISGYELFIGQGVDAWTLFTGLPLDQERLRVALEEDEP